MGILTRFTDIMKSNINALLDKCEDPAKMIDQTLRDLREDLAEVKKETANIIADAKSADRQVKECEEEITKYTTAAQNALKAGNEDDARTLIAKKQQYESNLVSYKKTQELTHANADKMRQMHDKLVNDIETLEARRDAIKATVASAKAQEHFNKIVSVMTIEHLKETEKELNLSEYISEYMYIDFKKSIGMIQLCLT